MCQFSNKKGSITIANDNGEKGRKTLCLPNANEPLLPTTQRFTKLGKNGASFFETSTFMPSGNSQGKMLEKTISGAS